MTRSRAAERRQEREAEQSRQRRNRLIIGGVIAVITLAVLVFLVTRPAEAPIPEASAARYEGLDQGLTTEGYPRLGNPAAPVEVKVYSSFASALARTFHREAIDGLVERVRGGEVQLIFVPLTLSDTNGPTIANGVGAARAAICAAEQRRFWTMQDAFFDWQERYGNQAFTNNRIVSGLSALQMDRGAYDACLGSSRPADVLNASENEAAVLANFSGVPTVAINDVVPVDEENVAISTIDVTAILERIDQAVAARQAGAAETPAAGEETPAAEVTPEATEEATQAPTETAAPTEEPTAEPTSEPTAEATTAS